MLPLTRCFFEEVKMNRISTDEIKEGVMFNAPVYFDDEKNMFLGAHKRAKKYHVFSLKRWNVPFLCTNGRVLSEDEAETYEKGRKASLERSVSSGKADVEDLDNLEEIPIEEFQV